MKNTMWIALALLVASAAAVGGLYGTKVFLGSGSESEKTAPAVCEAHGVARCPFCDPSLLESMGFCSGHGVPEAICTRCRDDLEAAFKAKNDWCAEHGLPESQCETCNPGTLAKFVGKTQEIDQLVGIAHGVAKLLPPRPFVGGIGNVSIPGGRCLDARRHVLDRDGIHSASRILATESHVPLAKIGSSG